MLPMPMLKVTGPSGDNVTPNTPANPTVGQANQPAAVAAQQNQQHADSNSYFQQLLSSVQTIDLEEETSPTMVRNLVGGTYCNHDTHTRNWRLNTSAPPLPQHTPAQTIISVSARNLSHSALCFQLIVEINSQVALFRDLLIHIGQSKDCPELREKVRKLRRSCVEACKHTTQLILPQVTKS